MVLDANNFNSGSPGAVFTNPVRYDPEAIKYLYLNEVMRPLIIQDTSLLGQPGKVYNKYIEGRFTVNALTEGTPTPVSTYTTTGVQVPVAEYGDAKQFTKEQVEYQFDSVIGNVRYNALGALAENRDAQLITTAMTTTTVGTYVNGKTNLTILATDIMDAKTITVIKSAMDITQARGLRDLVLHPVQIQALENDVNFIRANENPVTAAEILRTGTVGTYHGVNIHKNIQINTATENAITVYKAIALGNNQPMVYMQKRDPTFDFRDDIVLDRGYTFHYWEMFGSAILIQPSVMIVTSA